MARRRCKLLAATIALVACGCAAGTSQRPVPEILAAPEAPAPEGLRWPPTPEPERIRHLATLRDASQLGGRLGWWRALVDAITGADRPRFVRPAAACARGSLLAVADPGAGVVHRIDLAERSWSRLRGGDDWRLQLPVGVACLPDGRLLVADSALEEVWAFSADGESAERFLEERLARPTALAFDALAGRVWVAETLAHRVHAFDLSGQRLLSVGRHGAAPGEFNHPTWLAADRRGGVWVTDSLNFRLQRIDGHGRPVTAFGTPGDRIGDFARPRGIAVGPHGRIFSVDALLDAVRIFDDGGQLLLAFGARGASAGSFWLPAGITLGDDELIFVCDSYNSRVEIYRYSPPEAGPR